LRFIQSAIEFKLDKSNGAENGYDFKVTYSPSEYTGQMGYPLDSGNHHR